MFSRYFDMSFFVMLRRALGAFASMLCTTPDSSQHERPYDAGRPGVADETHLPWILFAR